MRYTPHARHNQRRQFVSDFHTIRQAALANARTILDTYLPGGRVEGNEYVVRNPRRYDRNPGSFKVNLRTGEWGDFAINVAGRDLISLIAYVEERPHWKAAQDLAELLCLVERDHGH